MPDIEQWRTRLRAAIHRTGKTHWAIAEAAGISPTTLSRILNGRMHPRFEIVVRIAHAAGETVGALLGERGYALSVQQREQLRRAAFVIESVTRE